MADKKVIREVNELKIRCTNHREGCGWVGELGGLKNHLGSENGCGYVWVTCTNKGCRKRVSRKDLQTHLYEKCYYRPRESRHGKSLKKQGHYSECPDFPLDCPNSCGMTGIRHTAMPDHHRSCPLEPLDCPFKDAGCTEKIARKDMEDHMTANQHAHMLLSFQTLQRCNRQMKKELHERIGRGQREIHLLKDDIRREIDSLEESIRHNTNRPESTAQSLSRMKSILQVSLDKIGDTLTFRVTDFSQLRKKKNAWQSPTFSISDKVRVCLAVYPSGVGRGQGSHVSVSLILTEVVKKEETIYLEYNVSVAAIGQHRSITCKTLKLCNNDNVYSLQIYPCSAVFPLPGEVLRSEEQFLEIEEANSLLENDSVILELKLLKHEHDCSSSDSDSD